MGEIAFLKCPFNIRAGYGARPPANRRSSLSYIEGEVASVRRGFIPGKTDDHAEHGLREGGRAVGAAGGQTADECQLGAPRPTSGVNTLLE